jgi:hypothetical protein
MIDNAWWWWTMHNDVWRCIMVDWCMMDNDVWWRMMYDGLWWMMFTCDDAGHGRCIMDWTSKWPYSWIHVKANHEDVELTHPGPEDDDYDDDCMMKDGWGWMDDYGWMMMGDDVWQRITMDYDRWCIEMDDDGWWTKGGWWWWWWWMMTDDW